MLENLLSDVKITRTAVFLHFICSPLQRLLLCMQRCKSGEGQVDKTSWWGESLAFQIYVPCNFQATKANSGLKNAKSHL